MSNVLIVCYLIIAVAYIQSIFYNCYIIILICLFSILVFILLLSRNIIPNDIIWFTIYYSIFKETILMWKTVKKRKGLLIIFLRF